MKWAFCLCAIKHDYIPRRSHIEDSSKFISIWKYPYDDAVLSKWEDEEWFQQKTTQTMSLEVLLERKVSNMKSFRLRDILRADDFEAKLLEFSCYVAVVLR